MATVAPNTQPIFIRSIFHWGERITNQSITGGNPVTATPVLLGTAGDNGALIETIECVQMPSAGFGTLYFWTKNDDLEYKLIVAPVSLSGTKTIVTLPRLLAPFRTGASADYAAGLRLEPGENLYVGAEATITGLGWWVHVWGGNY